MTLSYLHFSVPLFLRPLTYFLPSKEVRPGPLPSPLLSPTLAFPVVCSPVSRVHSGLGMEPVERLDQPQVVVEEVRGPYRHLEEPLHLVARHREQLREVYCQRGGVPLRHLVAAGAAADRPRARRLWARGSGETGRRGESGDGRGASNNREPNRAKSAARSASLHEVPWTSPSGTGQGHGGGRSATEVRVGGQRQRRGRRRASKDERRRRA